MSREIYNWLFATNVGAISKEPPELKAMGLRLFQKYFDNGLLTLKFHLRDHVTTKIERSGGLRMLDTSSI